MTKDEALDLMLNALELIGHIDGEVRSNFYAKKTIDLVKKKLNTQGEEHMNTGGPAFPVHPNVNLDLDKRWCGMTLRDYFAAKAMQGLISSIGEWSAGTPNLEFSDSVAIDAYWIADSMLKAREA